MVLVVPLMAALAVALYPATWKDLGQLHQADRRSALWQSLLCGLLMFLYLAMLYISIGLIPTGIALTLFFTYPVFTALFSWGWLGDRPSRLKWSVMGLVLLGSVLTLPHTPMAGSSSGLGVGLGLASGVTYALYAVIAQKSFERLHPVPFTWISFTTTLVLSSFCLLVWNLHEANLPWTALWVGGLFSAIATFAGHLLNNFGIRRIGATSAAMIAATNPTLTVILAWVAIEETLQGVQLIGVLIVTLSIVLLSRERRSA